jgi:hypothetical protein
MTQFKFVAMPGNAASIPSLEFESGTGPVAGKPFDLAQAAPTTGQLLLVVDATAGLSATADPTAFSFTGACLVKGKDSPFEIRSGRLVFRPTDGNDWPAEFQALLDNNWGDLGKVDALALGSDGLQLEATIDTVRRVFRWSPTTTAEAVLVPGWLELRFGSEPADPPTLPAALEIEVTDPPARLPAAATFRRLLPAGATLVFGQVETPAFGLKFLGREWFPRAMWTWQENGRQFTEFVDVPPGPWHPHLQTPEELQVDWTDATPHLKTLPPLESTGRTTDGTFDLPAAWQFGAVESGNKSAPGSWIHWRLTPATAPTRLAVSAESLTSGLHGLWEFGEFAWDFEVGLAPLGAAASSVPRIRLTIETGAVDAKATLSVRAPQIYALTPQLRFFNRALVDPESLPHTPQLRESLLEAQIEFTGPTSSGLAKNGQVKMELKGGQPQLQAGPRAVEAWVAGPLAGLSAVSRTGANLVDPASVAKLSAPVVTRDRNQGLVDLPVTSFALKTQGNNPVAIQLTGDLPQPARSGPTIAALLPWAEWTVATDPAQPDVNAYHRNLLLEQFEHEAVARRDAAPGAAPDPQGIVMAAGGGTALAIDQLQREAEQDRRQALRDRFALAAPSISTTTPTAVQNWFPGADTKVKLSPEGGSLPGVPGVTVPRLEWTIDAIQSASQAGSRQDVLEAAISWSAAVDATQSVVPPLDPKFTPLNGNALPQGEFRAVNGHVPPVFRTAGIRSLDAAQIYFRNLGRVLLVVFIDDSGRTFAWLPGVEESPRLLPGLPQLQSVRIVPVEGIDVEAFNMVAIDGTKAKVWSFEIAEDDAGLIGEFTLAVTKTLPVDNVKTLHVAIARQAQIKPFLIIGANDGGNGRVVFIAVDDLTDDDPTQIVVQFPGDTVETLDFRNMVSEDPQTQVLLMGSTNKIHVVVWANNLNAQPRFSSATGTPNDRKIPALVAAGNAIGSIAVQGFDPGQQDINLHVWGVVDPGSAALLRQWKLHLPITGTAPATVEPVNPTPGREFNGMLDPEADSLTGLFPAGTLPAGPITQVAFGDRTEVASRFLAAVTSAGANSDSAWMRWEPNWNTTSTSDGIPARSFFQLTAHRGRVTGASLVPMFSEQASGAAESATVLGYVLVTGGDDGAVVVRDVASGRELQRHEPRDWAADSLGSVRRVRGANAGQSVRDGQGLFTAELIRTANTSTARDYVVLATTDDQDGPGIQLIAPATAATGADIRISASELLLEQKNPAENRWSVVRPNRDLPVSLGTIGIFSTATDGASNEDDPHRAIRRWPRIGGFPFFPTDAQFEFAPGPAEAPRPEKLQISGVLLNPADVRDIPVDEVPAFVRAALQSDSPVGIKISLAYKAADKTYEVATVEGNFDWRFPLADQLPPVVAARSVPGRLESLHGTVQWRPNQTLQLNVEPQNSRGEALGKLWPLDKDSVQLQLDPAPPAANLFMVREALVAPGALIRRGALPQIADDASVRVVELGRDENGRLTGLTASENRAGDLYLSDVDTGRATLRCRDRYRSGVLVRRNPFDGENGIFDAALVHTDGTVRVWPAVGSRVDSGASVFHSELPRQELRRFQPDSAVEEVVVFDGDDVPPPPSLGNPATPDNTPQHHRLYLFRCADGSARLWDEVHGEIVRYDIPESVVTAIAIAPQLGQDLQFPALQPLFAADEAQSAVITIVTLGGADGSVRSHLVTRSLLDSLAERSASQRTAAFRQFFNFAGPVASVSTEIEPFDTNPDPNQNRNAVRLLACSRLGEKPIWVDLLDGRTESSPLDSQRPIGGRLLRSDSTLYFAIEFPPAATGAIRVTRRQTIDDFEPFVNIGNTGNVKTLALVKSKNANALLVAGGDRVKAARITAALGTIALTESVDLPPTSSLGDQAVAAESCAAGRVLLAIDHTGRAQVSTTDTNDPPTWNPPLEFGSQTDRPVSAASWAEVVVPVALRIVDGRVEVWDLDFESRRWVSPASLGTFQAEDLPALCFRVINGRPILVVGRSNAVEFWDLRTGRIEDRRLCAGRITHLDVAIDDRGELEIALGMEVPGTPSQQTIRRMNLDDVDRELEAAGPAIERLSYFRGADGWDLAAVRKTQANSSDRYQVSYWIGDKKRSGNVDTALSGTEIIQLDFIPSPSTDGQQFGLLGVRTSTNGVKFWKLTLHDAAVDPEPAPGSDSLHTLRVNNDGTTTPINGDDASALDGFPSGKILAATVEARIDRRVVRVVTPVAWHTWEVLGPAAVVPRTHPVVSETPMGKVNLRIDLVNWPSIASLSDRAQLRVFDRLSGVLRQTSPLQLDDASPLVPLAKGLLGVPAGANPMLIAAGTNGIWSINFATGKVENPPRTLVAVALGWDPQLTEFPLAVAWAENNGSPATKLIACKRAAFDPLAAGVTADATALTDLVLWPKPQPAGVNGWHLSGFGGGVSTIFSDFTPAPSSTRSHSGRVIAAAWPVSPQSRVRPLSALRPDPGPDLDFRRLLLVVLDGNAVELRDVVFDDAVPTSAWRIAGFAGPVGLVADDLGIRVVAPENGAAHVLSPAPWVRILEASPPQFDLRLKCSSNEAFQGRLTPDYHFEIDVKANLLRGAGGTLVARPSLVQGDFYTFHVESTSPTENGFVRGVMILGDTASTAPLAPAADPTLNGLILWETIERDANAKISVGGVAPFDAKAELRALWKSKVVNSQVQPPAGTISGVVHNSTADPSWQLHLAEQPTGEAFAFLRQQGSGGSIEGFVPVSVSFGDNLSWSIVAADSWLAFAEKPDTTASPRRGLPLVRDDVFLPFPAHADLVQEVEGQIVDLVDAEGLTLGDEQIGKLGAGAGNNSFAVLPLPDAASIPLDLLGGLDAAVAIPKESIDVLQLVHRREHGGRLRASRSGTAPLPTSTAPDSAVDGKKLLVSPVALRDDGARLLFESLTVAATSSATSGGSGLSIMRTESVMAIHWAQSGASGDEATSVRNLLTATAVAPTIAGLSNEIFTGQAIRAHAAQLGSTGVLVKRTLDFAGRVDFQFVNSPFHALESQTLVRAATVGFPELSPLGATPLPQFVSPNIAAGRHFGAPPPERLFELQRPHEADPMPGTLRYRSNTAALTAPGWRMAVAERTLFEDFDVVDEDDSPLVSPAAGSATFLPTDATFRCGLDKPGAVRLRRLRGVFPAGSAWQRTQPLELAEREPQQVAAPATAKLEQLQAVFHSPTAPHEPFADIIDLSIEWLETLGSEPIGQLATVEEMKLVVPDGGNMRFESPHPVFAVFQRYGESLSKVPADAPELLADDSPVDLDPAPTETYLVATFNAFPKFTPNVAGGVEHSLFIRWVGSTTLEPLDNYFALDTAHAGTLKIFREQDGKFAHRLKEVNKDGNGRWNFVWAPSATPADVTTLPALYPLDGTIRNVPAESLPAKVVGVLRTKNAKPLFGTGPLEQTLFFGDSASSTGVDAGIETDNDGVPRFQLSAEGHELVGVTLPLNESCVFLVKTLSTGANLGVGQKIVQVGP